MTDQLKVLQMPRQCGKTYRSVKMGVANKWPILVKNFSMASCINERYDLKFGGDSVDGTECFAFSSLQFLKGRRFDGIIIDNADMIANIEYNDKESEFYKWTQKHPAKANIKYYHDLAMCRLYADFVSEQYNTEVKAINLTGPFYEEHWSFKNALHGEYVC